jgi:PqqD family protein of HPr-rel-A system
VDGNSRWCSAARDVLGMRVLDDELVIYNETTGSTHHLSVLGSVVMQALVRYPDGIAFHDLVRAISDDEGALVDDELEGAVARALDGLAALGLAVAIDR